MIIWMIKWLAIVLLFIAKIALFIINMYLSLCLNVFTLPLFGVLYLLCKLLHLPTPHFGNFGLTFYPKWSYKPSPIMTAYMKMQRNKELAKVKQHEERIPWEEVFFY